MREITDKINKHKIIGLKTDCKYFSNVGNLCSRVENGMMRCDEYLECEFKYIDALKEENKELKLQIDKQRNAKIQLKNLDSKFAEDYCNIKERLKELTKQNKEMRTCYKSNLELCKFQEKQINKLATCLEEIYSYCKSCEYGLDAQKIINYIDEILESENQ